MINIWQMVAAVDSKEQYTLKGLDELWIEMDYLVRARFSASDGKASLCQVFSFTQMFPKYPFKFSLLSELYKIKHPVAHEQYNNWEKESFDDINFKF